MPQKATKYLHRKCRREACGKWSVFRAGDPEPDACTFCGHPFGKLAVGLDVQDAKTGDPEITGRDAREAPTVPAMKLPAVKPGDFEYVDPKAER